MLNLIFFGAPGAGKGTQAKKTAEKYNLSHLSTGDILRAEVSNNTELGAIAKSYMDKGELLPDDIIIKMVENKIKEVNNPEGFIFDGFPRTLAQAEAFDAMLTKNKMRITFVIHLDVEKNVLIDRLRKRAEIENRKDDSDISIIENRISQYIEKTEPIKNFYQNRGQLINIDGMGEIDDIFNRIVEMLE